MHQYKHKKIRIFRIKLFRSTVCFFLTDTCIGIIKSSGVRKFSPNNKFPDKSSAGLTRLDCNKYFTSESASWAARLFTSVPRRLFWLWSSLFWRCDSSNLPWNSLSCCSSSRSVFSLLDLALRRTSSCDFTSLFSVFKACFSFSNLISSWTLLIWMF